MIGGAAERSAASPTTHALVRHRGRLRVGTTALLDKHGAYCSGQSSDEAHNAGSLALGAEAMTTGHQLAHQPNQAQNICPHFMDIFWAHVKEHRRVSATEFKEHCLALLEEVRQTRQSLLVTRHGKPVAEISPYVAPDSDSANPLKGSVLYQGDLVAPVDEKWDSAP